MTLKVAGVESEPWPGRLAAIGVFLVAVVVAWAVAGSLRQPPVWDGAMSVYPAAIELEKSGFDFGYLMGLPTFWEGGPNTHSLSLWTILVAGGIQLTGSLQAVLPILHLLSFALFGGLAVALFRLMYPWLGARSAAICAMVACLFPPLMIQAADIYLDLPVACAGAWAVVALTTRRHWLAGFLLLVAVSVKPLGVIFLPMVVIFAWRYGVAPNRKLKALLSVGPAVLALVLASGVGSPSGLLSVRDRVLAAVLGTQQLLLTVPDTLALLVIGCSVGFFAARHNRLTEPLEAALLAVIGLFGFAFTNGLVTFGVPLLPRYHILVVPLLLAGLATQCARSAPKLLLPGSMILAAWFVVGLSGVAYPYRDHPSFSVAERSIEYRHLLAIQVESIALLEQLGQEAPVYYDYFRYFLFEYPEMGYTSGPLRRGNSVYHMDPGSLDLDLMPERFALLFEYPNVGGRELYDVWVAAKEEGSRVVEHVFQSGPMKVYVVEIDRSR